MGNFIQEGIATRNPSTVSLLLGTTTAGMLLDTIEFVELGAEEKYNKEYYISN